MPVSKEEAEKYMILQVDVCFTKFPKNLTQAESKIESILKTVDYFYITKYRTRSSISKIVKRTIGVMYLMTFMSEGTQRITVKMIDHIKDSIRSLGYEVEILVSQYVDIDDTHGL